MKALARDLRPFDRSSVRSENAPGDHAPRLEDELDPVSASTELESPRCHQIVLVLRADRDAARTHALDTELAIEVGPASGGHAHANAVRPGLDAHIHFRNGLAGTAHHSPLECRALVETDLQADHFLACRNLDAIEQPLDEPWRLSRNPGFPGHHSVDLESAFGIRVVPAGRYASTSGRQHHAGVLDRLARRPEHPPRDARRLLQHHQHGLTRVRQDLHGSGCEVALRAGGDADRLVR